jgi:hypothetical protein
MRAWWLGRCIGMGHWVMALSVVVKIPGDGVYVLILSHVVFG